MLVSWLIGIKSEEKAKQPNHMYYVSTSYLAYLEYMAYVEVIINSRAFPLYCFVFQTCLCQTWLSGIFGYIGVVFHSRILVFDFFTTTCIEENFVLVKKLNNMNVKQSN